MRRINKTIMYYVIAVCLFVIIPVIYNNYKAQTIQTSCISNFKMIGIACYNYQKKFGISPFDVAANMDELIQIIYTSDSDLNTHNFMCDDKYPYEFIGNLPKNKEMPLSSRPVICDAPKNGHTALGINILYGSGYVEHSIK